MHHVMLRITFLYCAQLEFFKCYGAIEDRYEGNWGDSLQTRWLLSLKRN